MFTNDMIVRWLLVGDSNLKSRKNTQTKCIFNKLLKINSHYKIIFFISKEQKSYNDKI